MLYKAHMLMSSGCCRQRICAAYEVVLESVCRQLELRVSGRYEFGNEYNNKVSLLFPSNERTRIRYALSVIVSVEVFN